MNVQKGTPTLASSSTAPALAALPASTHSPSQQLRHCSDLLPPGQKAQDAAPNLHLSSIHHTLDHGRRKDADLRWGWGGLWGWGDGLGVCSVGSLFKEVFE